MLGEFAFSDAHPTAPADAATATDRIDIDPQLTGTGEDLGTNGKAPVLARGGEDDVGAFGHE